MMERTGKQIDAASVHSELSSHLVRDILLKIFYLEGCKRLAAATKIWQACDRCRRYQTLICYLTRRPLCTSKRKLAAYQCARQPERQLF